MTTRTPATAKAFVTTKGAITNLGHGAGRYFNLEDYENKSEFMAAAREYALWRIADPEPLVVFTDHKTNFDHLVGLDRHYAITDTEVSASLWQLLRMSVEDLTVLEAYLCVANLIDGSLSTTLEVALSKYLGFFANSAKYAEYHYKAILNDLPAPLANNLDMDKVGIDICSELLVCKGHYFNGNAY